MSSFIQTVTIKLSNGMVGTFIGIAMVNESTPKEVKVVDVFFSPPRPAPPDVKMVADAADKPPPPPA